MEKQKKMLHQDVCLYNINLIKTQGDVSYMTNYTLKEYMPQIKIKICFYFSAKSGNTVAKKKKKVSSGFYCGLLFLTNSCAAFKVPFFGCKLKPWFRSSELQRGDWIVKLPSLAWWWCCCVGLSDNYSIRHIAGTCKSILMSLSRIELCFSKDF